MSLFDRIITTRNARPIWKKLQASIVPIVDKKDLSNLSYDIERLRFDIKSNKYIPSIGHGYLGYVKSSGCTRFVPILSKEDMAIYYLLVLSLQDYLVEDLEGVYGAYRSIPSAAKKSKEVEVDYSIIDPYFQDTFNRKAWFKDWSRLNDLLMQICEDKSVGNFVLVSDIANFYDTIDVGSLISRMRSVIPQYDDVISLLGYFLSYWDRRIKGYNPSSKGIPQEIISDASRILSNFYLNDFDKRFIEYCKSENVLYIRWADDIILFGKSRQHLENVMHRASRMLLNLSLNFNASKTRHFSKREFKDYRALDLLQAINNKDTKRFEIELRRFSSRFSIQGGRIDTVVKASLNFLSAEPGARSLFAMNFVRENLKMYEHIGVLNEQQLIKKYILFGKIVSEMNFDVNLILKHPYAAPRATYLSFISKYKKRLVKEGVSLLTLRSIVNRIEKHAADSEITRDICVPAANEALK